MKSLLTTALDWALDRLLGAMSKSAPETERAPGQLDSRDVAIQNRASHVPEAHKVRACLRCDEPLPTSRALIEHDCRKVVRLPAPPRVPSRTRYDE